MPGTLGLHRGLVLLLALLTLSFAAAPVAEAEISLEEGPDTATTPKFEWNFGDTTGNVERVETVQWRREATEDLGPNLAAAGGGSCGDPSEFWGQSYGNADGQGPGAVVAGARGSWTARGKRSVEIDSLTPTSCSGDEPAIPVRTRYSFFDEGPSSNLVRMERAWSFAPTQEIYSVQGMRAYVPRLPMGTFDQEIHPNANGTELKTEGICNVCVVDSSGWNETWLAINSSSSNAGLLILRDSGDTSPASITDDYDSFSGSNNSDISLNRPSPSWAAPLTETEYLCFYDATTWPPAQRSATRLPDGCTPATPPINTAVPTVSAGAGNPRVGEQFTAGPGLWDNATGSFTYQWLRCNDAACESIPGANETSYTATGGDAGRALVVRVTATSAGGETDSARSSVAGSVSGHVYEGEEGPAHIAAGAAVQVCRRSGSPCRSTVTDPQGFYKVTVPVTGKYRVTAFPPSGSKALSRTREAITRVYPEVEKTGQDVIMPLPKLPPPNVGFGGTGARGPNPEGVPVVFWQEPFVITYETAIEDEVEAKVDFPDDTGFRVLPDQPVEASPNDPETGVFKLHIAALYPHHGAAHVTIIDRHPQDAEEEEREGEEKEAEENEEEEEQENEEEEEAEEEEKESEQEAGHEEPPSPEKEAEETATETEEQREERENEETRQSIEEEEEQQREKEAEEGKDPAAPKEVEFPLYIDPSGSVVSPGGAPIAGATVTLLSAETEAGPFTAVPDGSAVMSPLNRRNPDQSEADGHFGWDVVAGFYEVRATKSGCHAPGGGAIAETGVMTIPPPVSGLKLELECPQPSGPGSSGNPPGPQPTPIVHKKKPLKCRKGFKKRRVHGKAKCVKKKRHHPHR